MLRVEKILLFLNQKVAYRSFNFAEVGYSQVNTLTFKEIESFDMPDIRIEH